MLNSSKSKLAVIIGWLSLFIINYFPYIGLRIYAESAMFLIVSIWLLIYSHFEKSKSPLAVVVLSFVAGIGVAIKFNSVVLFAASIAIIFSLNFLKIRQKFYNLILNMFVVLGGFILGTWQVKLYYQKIFTRIVRVAGQSGINAAHGIGVRKFLDLSSYSDSLTRLINEEKYIIATFLLAICVYFVKELHKDGKKHSGKLLLALSVLLSTLLMIKYSVTYYQLPNLIIMAYIFSVFSYSFINKLRIPMIILLSLIVFGNLITYQKKIVQDIQTAIQLEEKVSTYPRNEISLWDYGVPTKEYAYLWTRDYAKRLFDDQLKKYNPSIVKMNLDLETIKDLESQKNVFDFCWKRLFITERRAKQFLAKHQDKELEYFPLVEKYGVIEYSYCFIES